MPLCKNKAHANLSKYIMVQVSELSVGSCSLHLELVGLEGLHHIALNQKTTNASRYSFKWTVKC